MILFIPYFETGVKNFLFFLEDRDSPRMQLLSINLKFGIFNCFNARTNKINLFHNILDNKVFLVIIAFIICVQLLLIYFGGELFRTAGLTLKELEIMLILAVTVIPVDFIRKLYLKQKGTIQSV